MNNESPENRRNFERLTFISKMELFAENDIWECEIIDISLKGLLFTKPTNWSGNIKNLHRVSISLDNSPSITMSINLAHIGDKSIGAKWKKIDVDSFSRLKRILELNSIDKRKISKELSYL